MCSEYSGWFGRYTAAVAAAADNTTVVAAAADETSEVAAAADNTTVVAAAADDTSAVAAAANLEPECSTRTSRSSSRTSSFGVYYKYNWTVCNSGTYSCTFATSIPQTSETRNP